MYYNLLSTYYGGKNVEILRRYAFNDFANIWSLDLNEV